MFIFCQLRLFVCVQIELQRDFELCIPYFGLVKEGIIFEHCIPAAQFKPCNENVSNLRINSIRYVLKINKTMTHIIVSLDVYVFHLIRRSFCPF